MLESIIGHEGIKEYFNKAISRDKLSHSYLFEGPGGVGKKMMAKEIAQILLCEDKQGVVACGTCKACEMMKAGTHPDLIWIEKDTKVTKIDTVRDQMVKEMDIKPYMGPYKIMVVTEADSLTIQAQNALLKTIEEPPAYGVIILITKNVQMLLPTIRSRCILLRFQPMIMEQLYSYLQDKPVSEGMKQIYVPFCDGSIGVLQQLIEDEGFLAVRERSIQYLERLKQANLIQLYDMVKEIVDDKELVPDILSFWTLWYRDLAVIKSTKEAQLYYTDYKVQLLDTSSKLTYNKISTSLEQIEAAKKQLQQNVYLTFIIENLLLGLKERKK